MVYAEYIYIICTNIKREEMIQNTIKTHKYLIVIIPNS